MKSRLALLPLALLLAAALTPARAGDAEIRQAVQTLAPGAQVKSVVKSPLPGVMEVTLDGAQGPMVVYADDKGEFIMAGDLLDVKNRRNLTKERMDKLTEVKWDSLPLENAIKVVRGDGKRKIAVFSDPDCPYCKKVEQELFKLSDITVYVFAYPLPMHADATRKSKLVWCSKDRAKAWLDLMLKNKVPEGKATCDTPIEKNLELGRKLRVEGTPALIFPNGKRVPGYMDAPRLEAALNQANGGK
ncbi:MAG: DsbC family protein [Pseudomonadota bacterium]